MCSESRRRLATGRVPHLELRTQLLCSEEAVAFEEELLCGARARLVRRRRGHSAAGALKEGLLLAEVLHGWDHLAVRERDTPAHGARARCRCGRARTRAARHDVWLHEMPVARGRRVCTWRVHALQCMHGGGVSHTVTLCLCAEGVQGKSCCRALCAGAVQRGDTDVG